MNTDPIADLLTRIRNAASAGHASVRVPYSKVKESILEIFQKNSFVKGVKVIQAKKNEKFEDLEVELFPGMPIHLTRKSSPGQRIYVSATDIRPVRNGYGIGVVSTSNGIMTTDEAKSQGVGGEYLCEVY